MTEEYQGQMPLSFVDPMARIRAEIKRLSAKRQEFGEDLDVVSDEKFHRLTVQILTLIWCEKTLKESAESWWEIRHPNPEPPQP